jgi:2-hydroxy-6-oxo-6-(2'-aminophenyl)hexa-2,4-dienoate hydrolase
MAQARKPSAPRHPATGASAVKREEPTANPWTEHFVSVGGIATRYLEAGQPARPRIVLIHGGGAGADSAGNWRHTMPLLAQEFHVFAVDMVGFGRSGKPDAASYVYSQSQRNLHLAEFLRAVDLQGAALIGNSMGGATALGVAMEHPELVGCLVLMGSAGLVAKITEDLKPIIYYDFTLEGMQRLVTALTGSRFHVSPELVRLRYELSIEPDTRRAYEAIMKWIRDQGGLSYSQEAIRKVKTPTLVVNGKEDVVVPISNAYRFLELLENSWGYFIPHCGHWAMIEAPEDFARAVRGFLSTRAIR